MTIGRSDYNRKVVPSPEFIGDDEDLFYFETSGTIAANSGVNIVNQAFSSTQDLYITQIIISTNSPKYQTISCSIGLTTVLEGYYERNWSIILNGVSALKIEVTQVLKVYNYNNDNVSASYSVSLRGFYKDR